VSGTFQHLSRRQTELLNEIVEDVSERALANSKSARRTTRTYDFFFSEEAVLESKDSKYSDAHQWKLLFQFQADYSFIAASFEGIYEKRMSELEHKFLCNPHA